MMNNINSGTRLYTIKEAEDFFNNKYGPKYKFNASYCIYSRYIIDHLFVCNGFVHDYYCSENLPKKNNDYVVVHDTESITPRYSITLSGMLHINDNLDLFRKCPNELACEKENQ